MKPLCIQADQVAPQAWRNGGGQTRELLVWPVGGANPAAATNANADWRLRISRADITADGPFSAFAGVQRWFVVLSGAGVVLHMPASDGPALDHTLLPGHAPLPFDGGLAPGCSLVDGETQDLNLMARGGSACMRPMEPGQAWLSAHAMCGLYTAQAGIWSDGLQSLPLAAHTLLWCAQGSTQPLRFTPDAAEPAQAWWLGFTPDPTP